MKGYTIFLLSVFLFFVCGSVFGIVRGATVSQECSNDFQKLMDCLSFATGKSNEPSKGCCSSMEGIKESDPKCLCYIMLQTHNGSAEIKNLGIQEARLLQLPSACQLKNSSLSYCPKLLGISANSSDAAIFTNASTAATPAAPAGTSAPDKAGNSSKQRHHLPVPLVLAMAILFYAFPVGSSSMISTWV